MRWRGGCRVNVLGLILQLGDAVFEHRVGESEGFDFDLPFSDNLGVEDLVAGATR